MLTNKVITYFLGVGILLTLFFIRAETAVDIRYFKDWVFVLFSFSFVTIFGAKPNQKMWIIPLIIIYSFTRIQASANFIIFYQWIMFISGMMLLYSLSTKKIDIDILLDFIVAASVISSIWIILEYLKYDPQTFIYKMSGLKNAARMRMVSGKLVQADVTIQGPLGQHTITGAFISCCLSAFFRKKFILITPLILFAIYLSNSAMSVICATISLILMVFLSYRAIVNFLIPIAVGLLFFYIKFPMFFSDNGRFQGWNDILKWHGFNFFGMGNGWFNAMSLIRNQSGQVFKHAHCELIDLYIAFGIPGIVALIYLLSKVRVKNRYIFCIFIALFINSLANLTYHISALSLISIICYSILTGEQYDQKEDYSSN